MSSLSTLLRRYKGTRALVNSRESQHYGWIVIDVEPKKSASTSVSVIHEVSDDLLILDYLDMKEMSYIPIEKIVKVNVILREK